MVVIVLLSGLVIGVTFNALERRRYLADGGDPETIGWFFWIDGIVMGLLLGAMALPIVLSDKVVDWIFAGLLIGGFLVFWYHQSIYHVSHRLRHHDYLPWF